eukprot:gene14672-biopygen11768
MNIKKLALEIDKRDVEQAGFPVTGKVGPNGVYENIKELEELKEPVKKDNEMLNELLEQMSSISMKVEDIEKERKQEKSNQYDLSMMYELRDEQRGLEQRLSAQETRLLTLEESGAENGRLIWKILQKGEVKQLDMAVHCLVQHF